MAAVMEAKPRWPGGSCAAPVRKTSRKVTSGDWPGWNMGGPASAGTVSIRNMSGIHPYFMELSKTLQQAER
jgi:hypothetical protein